MEYLETSKNGIQVYIDMDNSHASTHMKKNPQLYEIAKGIIRNEYITGPFREERNLKKEVGLNYMVRINKSDEIIYAKRPKRDTYIPFVKGHKPVPTSIVTLDIRYDESKYYLYTIYIGKMTPGLPGSDRVEEDTMEFWTSHAIIYGSQETLKETETTICPWDIN